MSPPGAPGGGFLNKVGQQLQGRWKHGLGVESLGLCGKRTDVGLDSPRH